MTESKAYLHFFRRNLLFLIIPASVFLLIGWWFNLRQPIVYQQSALLEVSQIFNRPADQIAVVDEAVTMIRQPALQAQLGIQPTSRLSAYKPAPVSLIIQTQAINQLAGKKDLKSAADYLISKYQFVAIGDQTIEPITSNKTKNLLLFGLSGSVLGLSLTLLKTYLQNY